MQDQQIGPYTIQKLLGSGGMADVYLAWDHVNRWPVALKLLRASPGRDDRRRQRFEREAEALTRLRHPHVVQVYNTGRADDGRTYIAMEYITGGDLHDLMSERRERLPVTEVVYLMRRVAGAVAYAHGQGIVHRDLKPGNILLRSETGEPVIADLGVASLGGAKPLTGTMESLGTPQYMAPEQAKTGAQTDGRADIYAIGVMLFELLTGKLPFADDNGWALLLRKQQESAPPILSARRDLDPRLAAVVDACLQRDPAARYQTAEALAIALDAFLPAGAHPPALGPAKGRKGEATPRRVPSTPRPSNPPVSSPTPTPDRSRQSLLWAIGGGLGLVLVLWLFISSLGGLGGEEPVRPETTVASTPIEPEPEAVTQAGEEEVTVPATSTLAPGGVSPPQTTETEEEPTPTTVIETDRPPAATARITERTGRAISDVYTRSGPGTEYAVNGGLTRNQEVTVLRRDSGGNWYLLDTPTGVAWVPATYIDVAGSSADIALVDTIPPPPPDSVETPGAAILEGTPIGETTGTPGITTPEGTPTSETTGTPGTMTPVVSLTPLLPGGPTTVLSFEAFGAWRVGDQANGTFTQSSEQAHGGGFSGKMDYDFPGNDNDYVVFMQEHEIAGTPNALKLWVYGDESGHYLNIWIVDADGQTWAVPMGRVRHSGWKELTGRIDTDQPWPWGHISGPDNGEVDYPIRFAAIVLDDAPDEFAGQGVIFVDDLTNAIVE